MELGIAGRRAAVAAATAGWAWAAPRRWPRRACSWPSADATEARVDAAVAEIGGDAVGIVADVSTPDGGRRFVEAAVGRARRRRHPRGQRRRPARRRLRATPFERYQPALEQNLLSIVAMTQAAVPAMHAQQWGRIVAITSMTVRQPIADADPVEHRAGRRHGVPQDRGRRGGRRRGHRQHGATRAAPHRPDRPSCTATTSAGPRRHPGRLVGDADDFGATVAFLCSEQAKFITGVGLHVDGGTFAGLQ